MSAAPIEVVAFDLGGVIVDLAGLDAFVARHGLQGDDFSSRWLGLGAGHDFERGATSPAEFAASFVAEFDLDVDPDDFLAEFEGWTSGLLPGAVELIADVRSRPELTIVTLSNTNAIHWGSDLLQHEVVPLFDRHFPSFQLGVAKPSPTIFERVAELLDVAPSRIAFVDDNLVNVEAAHASGYVAAATRGVAAARAALHALGLVPGR